MVFLCSHHVALGKGHISEECVDPRLVADVTRLPMNLQRRLEHLPSGFGLSHGQEYVSDSSEPGSFAVAASEFSGDLQGCPEGDFCFLFELLRTEHEAQ